MRECPSIPVIVGDAPELRVFLHRDGVVELGWAGRKAEHDGSSGFADGLGDLANFRGAIGVVADAVDLDVVESPIGIELEHRVVIGLAGGGVAHSPIALIPGAGGTGVGGVDGVEI